MRKFNNIFVHLYITVQCGYLGKMSLNESFHIHPIPNTLDPQCPGDNAEEGQDQTAQHRRQ